jgi:hypothetical protein
MLLLTMLERQDILTINGGYVMLSKLEIVLIVLHQKVVHSILLIYLDSRVL